MDNSQEARGNTSDDKMSMSLGIQHKNKIKTFAFLDLEATGLPGDDPRILELAMIAVSREDLLCMKDSGKRNQNNSTLPGCIPLFDSRQNTAVPHLPRVLHKYTRLYYPKKLITPKLEEITGLSNDMLHCLPGFSQGNAEAINLFLDLPKPLALVAHNGGRYDFPLLKAELNQVCSLDKFSDLLCVDTLKAIRHIDAMAEKEEEDKDILEITELAKSFDFEDLDDEIMEEAPVNKRARPEDLSEERMHQAGTCSAELSSQVQGGNQRILEISPELPMTPVKGHKPVQINGTPKTPQKLTNPLTPPVTPELSKVYCTPGTSAVNTQAITKTNKVRRNLTYGHGKRKCYSQPYKQTNIYKRLFDTEYEAHRAESDCQAMLEICGHYGEKFVDWSDTYADKFAAVKPMWVKRKTFKIT